MAISFSGLASGMDTSSWVEALVSVKQQEITKLETNRATINAAQETLNNIKSYFTSFQGILENITDARFGIASRDLFSQNLAESSNVSALSAIASTSAENTTYNIEINQLATATEVSSGLDITVTNTVSNYAKLDSKLFNLGDKDNPITAGEITFNVDGFNRTITIDQDSTIASFIDSLESIGISASYNEEKGIFSIGIGVEEDQDTHISPISDTTGVIAALHLQDVNYGYKTNVIDIVTTTTVSGTATTESLLKDLGISNEDCAFQIVSGGKITTNNGIVRDLDETVVNTITTFNENSTLGDVLDVLSSYGINATINSDGTLSLTSTRHTSSTANGEEVVYNMMRGSLAEALGFTEFEDPEVVLTRMYSTDIVNSTIETVINRDSTLEQIGAFQNSGDTLIIRTCNDGGGKIDDIVATIDTLTADSTVQDLFNTLTAYGITGSISDGVITLNSTAGNYIDGNIATNIGILHPVEETYYTTEPIQMTSSEEFNTSTTLGALGMSSDGSVVIYSPVYGIVSVNIAKELTVQQFCDKINNSNYGIKAEISNNKVTLSELEDSGAYVKGMSSILQSVLKLNVGEDQSYDTTTINVYSNTDSGYIEYDDTGVAINSNTVISSINNYSQGNGQLLLHQNGVVSTITVDSTLTLEEFINNPIVGLAQYGLSGQILSDGKAYITANSEIYLEEVSGGSNILSALKMSNLQTTWNGDHVDGKQSMQYTLTITTTVAATRDTALNTWDYETVIDDQTKTITSEGTLVFKANDYYKTVNIDEYDTFRTLINKLEENGIKAYMSRGAFYIASGYDNIEFVADESTSSLADLIHLGELENLGGYSASSQAVIATNTTHDSQRISAVNYSDMDTKLKTLGISSGKLTVYSNGRKADIEINEDWTFSRLQQEFATKFGNLRISFKNPTDEEGSDDGYLRIFSVDSSDKISLGSTSDKTNFVAITGMSSTSDSIMTSTRQLYKMNDKTAIGEYGLFREAADQATTLKSMGITNGNFNITHDGSTKTISISDNDTLATLQSKINEQFSDLSICFDLNGRLEDGLLKIKSENDTDIKIESADSNASNILSIAGLSSDEDTEVAGTKRLYQSVKAGSFKVGDADIYIQADNNGNITTTMADIVSQINASERSLATAYWDSIDGKLVIKSTLTGASAINIEAGDTNLTDILGLTNNDSLIMSAQSIGKNAILTINGTTYTSLSNNVTSESTGIDGLTLNLKGLTNGSAVQLTVKRDTETLTNNITNVLDAYNELITNVDAAIAKDGKLKDQSLLKLIRNNLRTAMTSSDLGTTRFKNLASIGIKASDAAAGNVSTSNSDITLLSLNTEEFLKAFENYEDDVKALLIGSTDANGNVINKGIFTKIEELIDNALTAASGYFVTANNAFNSDKEKITQKIVNGTAAIEKYKARLEKKFSSMDIMIASMQNQFQSFLS